MHIHIVAVAGTGMGALAGLLVELGHTVTGSDTAFDPPMGPLLAQWGVQCQVGFDPLHLEPAPDLVVIGNVCRANNPEARAALERGLPYTHIAGALQRFALEGTAPLVVAGTHGKTTTTSLAAWLLDQSGLEPGFLVGGIPENFGRSFRSAGGRRLPLAPSKAAPEQALGKVQRRVPFVVEGDEYDTAFFEKSAKFLHYRPEVAIVTSIEHDHIDIYPTLESYLDAFARFVALVPERGLIVANAADALVVEVVQKHAQAEVAWYALQGEVTHGVAPHFLGAKAQESAEGTTFDLFLGGMAAGRWLVKLYGEHNLRNSLAALGAALRGYAAPLPALVKALATFGGVKRRQELRGRPANIAVYDDFAHHPTSVRETLKALRLKEPHGKLWAVFEPRSATACRRLHQAEYASAFDAADYILLAPLGRQGLAPEETLDLAALSAELRARGKLAWACASVAAILSRILESAAPGDSILLLSNGAFGGIHEKLLAELAQRDSKQPDELETRS